MGLLELRIYLGQKSGVFRHFFPSYSDFLRFHSRDKAASYGGSWLTAEAQTKSH